MRELDYVTGHSDQTSRRHIRIIMIIIMKYLFNEGCTLSISNEFHVTYLPFKSKLYVLFELGEL